MKIKQIKGRKSSKITGLYYLIQLGKIAVVLSEQHPKIIEIKLRRKEKGLGNLLDRNVGSPIMEEPYDTWMYPF